MPSEKLLFRPPRFTYLRVFFSFWWFLVLPKNQANASPNWIDNQRSGSIIYVSGSSVLALLGAETFPLLCFDACVVP